MTQNTGSVLIVDDDQDIRDLLKILIEADGYQVQVAADGFEAWELMEAGESPSIVLLDMMMPRMDGEHFLRKLRKSRHAKTPLVLMSGNDSSRVIASELNAVCCLMKPVEFDELMRTVRRFVQPEPKQDVA